MHHGLSQTAHSRRRDAGYSDSAAGDLETLRAHLRQLHPLEFQALLVLGELGIHVKSNSALVLERLCDSFEFFRQPDASSVRLQKHVELEVIECPPPDFDLKFTDWYREPGKVRLKERIADVEDGRVVQKIRTGMQFLVGPATCVAVGPCLANINQVVNFIVVQCISHGVARGSCICHAAGVAIAGAGLAISAVSGGGKSTLAMHLMSSGADFVSNDRLLIRAAGSGVRMAGVPKLPRVNPGTLLNNAALMAVLPADRREAMTRLSADELWALEEKYDVPLRDCFPAARFVAEVPVRAIVLLNWRRNEPGSADPVQLRPVRLDERVDLLQALMKCAGPFDLGSIARHESGYRDPDVATYRNVLRCTQTFELTGQVDFTVATQRCLELLQS